MTAWVRARIRVANSIFQVLASTLTLLVPALAMGAGEAASGQAIKEPIAVVVIEARPSGPIDQRQVEGLTSLLTSEIAAVPGLRVISSADVRDLLGFEAQRQLLGCDESNCFAEIGGALGASYLLSSEVARFGESWLLSLVLLDLEAATPISRVTVRKSTEEQLLDAVGPSIHHVLKDMPGIDPSVLAALRPAPPRAAGSRRILVWSSIAGGTASLAAGSVLYGTARYHQTQMIAAGDTAIYRRSEVDTYQRNANLGLGLLAGGAALVGVGVAIQVLSNGTGGDSSSASSQVGSSAWCRVEPLLLADGFGVMIEVKRW